LPKNIHFGDLSWLQVFLLKFAALFDFIK